MGEPAYGAQMEREIREQPAALRRALASLREGLEPVPKRAFGQVVLVARGSSDNAALYLRYLVEVFLGIPAILASPSVLTLYGRTVQYRDALGIAISQSGESPDVRAVIRSMRDQGCTTLAITNTPGAPLAAEAESHLDLAVGKESSIAATKTYTASLLAAHLLVRHLGGELEEPRLPDDDWIGSTEAVSLEALDTLMAAESLVALARGFSFASAQETALKLTECALLPCRGYSTADFSHGPKAASGPGLAAIVFGEPPAGLYETGSRVVQAPDAGRAPDAPIREIVFSQFLALHASRARGIDPDRVPNLSKVTRTY
jgi:glucosamine--fructose-6-phosphate aminotransferase (isomerizing)